MIEYLTLAFVCFVLGMIFGEWRVSRFEEERRAWYRATNPRTEPGEQK